MRRPRRTWTGRITRTGLWRGRLIERPANPDTRRFIQNALATSVKVQLSPEMYTRYRTELDARSAEQKRAWRF